MTAERIPHRLEEMDDVENVLPQDGQTLIYNTSTHLYEHATAAVMDPDITVIGAIDSTVAGMIASDGAGWIQKTYAQVKTALGLVKADVGLGNVVNADTTTTANITDSSNKRFVTDAQQTVIGNTSGTNTGDQSSVTGNAGTATKLATARNIDGQSFDGSAAITVIAPGTHAATGKTTPVDADELPLVDSAASNVLKKLTWANLKATLKTYTDTLYPSGSGTSTGTNTGDQTTVSGNAGTATALQTGRTIDGQTFDGTANITVIAPGTHAATGKTTPVDADELSLVDSAASNVLKKLTWANVKATLKTYFDTLYYAPGGTDVAVADGGTGASSAATARSNLGITTVATDTIYDNKGDIPIGTGADTSAKLAVGTDFLDELIPDSSQTTGVRWGQRRSGLRPTGALYETYPRQFGAANRAVLVTQRLLLQAIDLPNGLLITSITFVSGTTQLSGGNHQIFGIYDDASGSSSGTARALLRGTSDDTSTAWAASSAKTLGLTSTYTTTRSGLFYLGCLIDATVPSLVGLVTLTLDGLAPVLGGNANTGQTSLPNPASAPTGVGETIYAYVS